METAARPTRARLPRRVALVAPLLLIAIAVLQNWRAHTIDQSSWAGVGFGMFATYESEITRYLHIELVTAGKVERVPMPAGVDQFVLEAREVPTERNLRRLGDRVLAAHPEADAVRVQLWAIEVHTDPMVIDSDVLVAVEVPR